MSKICERIKKYRSELHLTQDYVAKYLGISRAAFTQIELGNRKISADELAKLSIIFGVSADSLLYDESITPPTTMFARSFEKLDATDQAEIMNLIRFKKMMKEQNI